MAIKVVKKMKNKQMIYGTVINYVTVFVQMISTVVVTPYLIKIFGDNDYGIYKIIVSLAAYLIILNFGVGNTLIRFLSELRAKGEDKGDAAKGLVSFSIALNFGAGILAVLVGSLMFQFIPNLFVTSLSMGDLQLARKIFVILLISAIFSILTDVYTSYLFVYEKYTYVKTVDLFKYLLRVALIFSLINMGKSATLIAYIDLYVSIFVFGANFLYAVYKGGMRFKICNLKKSMPISLKDFFLYSFLFFLNLIIEQLIWNTDSIIIGMRLNASMVSIFSSGAIISAAFNSMTQIISTMIFPKIVMKFSVRNPKEKSTEVMVRISRLQAFIAFYILGGYLVVGKFFVTDVWLDPSYELAWSTSIIVMVGTLFSSLMGSGHLILRAINKQAYFLVCEFVIFLANVIATYMLVKPLGIKGAAYSTTAAYVIGMCAFIVPYLKKTIGLDIRQYLRSILPIVASMVCMSIVLYVIANSVGITSKAGMVVWGGIYTIIYIALAYIISSKDEKEALRTMRKKGTN